MSDNSMTREEARAIVRAREEDEMQSMNETAAGLGSEVLKKLKSFTNSKGHALNVLTLENIEIGRLAVRIDDSCDNEFDKVEGLLKDLLNIRKHYGKLDQLIFPILSDEYGMTGSANVLWRIEDEMVADLKGILKKFQDGTISGKDDAVVSKIRNLIDRINEMIDRERTVLFPLCTAYFTNEEWDLVRADMDMYGPCLIQELPVDSGQVPRIEKSKEGKITINGGSFTLAQLRALLNTLPMEITLVDENNINAYFNEGEKLFVRPWSALGRSMFFCHPPKVQPAVRQMIRSFKIGEKDSASFWSEKNGHKVMVNYYALRADDGEYLGTLEATQIMDGIIEHIEKGGKPGPMN